MLKQSAKKVFSKLVFPLMVLLLITAGCSSEVATDVPQAVQADGKVVVEVLYLNHLPVKSAINEVKTMLDTYEDQVFVQYYTFGSDAGEAFAEDKGIRAHTPIVIFVNGEMEHTLDGEKVEFFSFPQGEGTPMMEDGGWSIVDLETVIEKAIGEAS
jgi:hypothetical protein